MTQFKTDFCWRKISHRVKIYFKFNLKDGRTGTESRRNECGLVMYMFETIYTYTLHTQ